MHLINGSKCTEISVADRGLLYGHSVFETIRVHNRTPLLWGRHVSRLQLGCQKLGLPLDVAALTQEVNTICLAHDSEDFVLRVSQTMGSGGRGYLSPNRSSGSRIVSVHAVTEYPKSHYLDGVNLGVCELRLSHQPELAGIKHSNRLEQIIARSQWQEGWHEALLLDQAGRVVEATQSNVFVVQDSHLKTPPLDHCGVAGVMREFIKDSIAGELGLDVSEAQLSLADIMGASEVFVTNSLIGLWPVRAFQDRTFKHFEQSHTILNALIKHDAIPAY